MRKLKIQNKGRNTVEVKVTLKPEIAVAFAESPSVKIKVHLADCLVPAKLASSNFLIHRTLSFLVPSVFLPNLEFSKSIE